MSQIKDLEQEIAACAAHVAEIVRRVRELNAFDRQTLVTRLRLGDRYAQLAAEKFASLDDASLPVGLVGMGRGVRRDLESSAEVRHVLAPCARVGKAGDWWTERHRSCTGSHHVGGVEVRCQCSCHIRTPAGGS